MYYKNDFLTTGPMEWEQKSFVYFLGKQFLNHILFLEKTFPPSFLEWRNVQPLTSDSLDVP